MKKTLALLAATSTLMAISAQATPIRLDGPEANLQTILNGLPGPTNIDVANDQATLDEGFVLSGFKGMAEIIVEHAGYKDLNSFGIYDIYDPTNRKSLFGGSVGAGAYTSFWPTDFTLFGFYLDTPAGIWFSHSSHNADGADHMVAYQLGGDYIFGWEDLASTGWDQDYNDFVVLVSGVQGVNVSVPEPATLGLLGLGMLGLGAFRRRKATA